jgi:hypothetical protein
MVRREPSSVAAPPRRRPVVAARRRLAAHEFSYRRGLSVGRRVGSGGARCRFRPHGARNRHSDPAPGGHERRRLTCRHAGAAARGRRRPAPRHRRSRASPRDGTRGTRTPVAHRGRRDRASPVAEGCVGIGLGLIQCPITRTMVAICGYRVRRGGCIDLALRLAFRLRIRRLLILHTREIGLPAGAWRRSPDEVQPARPAGAGAQPPKVRHERFRTARRLLRRASPPRFRMRRICHGLIRSFRRCGQQPM